MAAHCVLDGVVWYRRWNSVLLFAGAAEQVAKGAAERARVYLAAPVAVGRHLADQLLLPMALAGGGEFTTLPVSAHSQSHASIIETFLGRHVSAISSDGVVHARIGEPGTKARVLT